MKSTAKNVAIVICFIFALFLIFLRIGKSVDSIREEGYARGFSAGREEGYDEGYSHGLSSGSEDGYCEGYDEGYSNGITDAYFSDYAYTEYGDGYHDGYADGYADCMAEYGLTDEVTGYGKIEKDN